MSDLAPPVVPVVWVAPEAGADAAVARRALDEWARSQAKGLRLGAPTPESEPTRVVPIPWAVAEETERELAAAREALVALDVDAVERSLARAEAALRAAPELPNAAWLLAETQRGWAARYSRLQPRDAERAARAARRADALDGGRAPGVGEARSEGAEPRATVELAIDAPGPWVVRIDGVSLNTTAATATTASATEGEHQVTVSRDEALVWAGWVAFAPDARVSLPVPPRARAVSCSLADLADVRVAREAGAPDRVAAPRVRCARWIAARAAAPPHGAVRVAICTADACAPFATYRAESLSGARDEPRSARAEHTRFPAWVAWTLVGAGVVATGAVVLVASGALRSPPNETRFVGGGLKPAGLALAF